MPTKYPVSVTEPERVHAGECCPRRGLGDDLFSPGSELAAVFGAATGDARTLAVAEFVVLGARGDSAWRGRDRARRSTCEPVRRQQRSRTPRRTVARSSAKAASSDDDGEPPRLFEADPRRARGLDNGGPHFQYEVRQCLACGDEFKNFWADGRPMPGCDACCAACESTDCPLCGVDADREVQS